MGLPILTAMLGLIPGFMLNALQQILTPEQFAKYQEIVAAHSKKKMDAGHKGQGHQK